MSAKGREEAQQNGFEAYAWYALVATVALVPLAVAKFPFSDVPLTFTAFGYPQTVLLTAGISSALALWAVALYRRQTEVFLSAPMVPVGVLVAWSAVATVAAISPVRSLLGRSTSSLSLAQLAVYAIAFFLVVQLVRSRERIRLLSWSVVLSASAVALIALTQQLFGVDPFGVDAEPWRIGRGFATLGNPDHLGTFLVLPLLVSAVLFLFEEDRRPVMPGATTALLATVLTGTLTRGAWIAALAGLALLGVLVFGGRPSAALKRRALVLLGLFVASIVVALLASDLADLGTRFSSYSAGVSPAGTAGTTGDTVNAISSDRLNVWRAALRITAERPLTGTGPGAFDLGWYRHAVRPASVGGEVAVADDAHSLVVYLLATTGVPGLAAYLAAVALALVYGARASLSLVRKGVPKGTGLHYIAWFAGATALQVALLVGAVSAPIMLIAFLSLAVVLRPTVRPSERAAAPPARLAIAVPSLVASVALVATLYPTLSAELAAGRIVGGESPQSVRFAVENAPWNLDVQKAYFEARVAEVRQFLAAGAPVAGQEVSALADELHEAAAKNPHELSYPAVGSKVLTEASSKLGDRTYAEASVRTADEALAIMPESLPVRVQKAIALANLERFGEMAETLAEHWEYETVTAYPGILYAQALAYSGERQQADAVFAELHERFPNDGAAIESARAQTQQADGQ